MCLLIIYLSKADGAVTDLYTFDIVKYKYFYLLII